MFTDIPLSPPRDPQDQRADDDVADDWDVLDPRFDQPQTPSSVGDDAHPGAGFGAAPATSEDGDSDDDYAHGRGELVPRRKPGGYDSRVEQILYENPELPILITDAGKSLESGGRYIVYTIRTGVRPSYHRLLSPGTTTLPMLTSSFVGP